MSRIRVRSLTFLVAASMVAGCPNVDLASRRNSAPSAPVVRSDSGSAVTRVKLDPGALRTVPSAPVNGWRGPGDQPFEVALRTTEREPGHARRFGSVTLPTALRARPLGQYPCTSCHLGRNLVMTAKRIADAHQDVQPVHPKQTGSRCSTCHASDSVEQLRLESGSSAYFDESYRLCAQCHFSQADAWAHGSHGKRLDGWQGRRVVMGCTDCHDPHRPALQTRIPFRAPQIERPKDRIDER